LTSCNTDELAPVNNRDYFPLKVGSRWLYSVSETVYDEINDPVTETYEEEWIAVDSFPGQGSQIVYVLNRFKKNDNMAVALETWSARINDSELVIQEGNEAFVRLSFPVKTGVQWNMNRYNSREEDLALIISTGRISTAEEEFESGAMVEQHNEVNALEEDIRRETYAFQVGLVESYYRVIENCVDFNGCSQPIVAGVEQTRTLLSYEP